MKTKFRGMQTEQVNGYQPFRDKTLFPCTVYRLAKSDLCTCKTSLTKQTYLTVGDSNIIRVRKMLDPYKNIFFTFSQFVIFVYGYAFSRSSQFAAPVRAAPATHRFYKLHIHFRSHFFTPEFPPRCSRRRPWCELSEICETGVRKCIWKMMTFTPNFSSSFFFSFWHILHGTSDWIQKAWIFHRSRWRKKPARNDWRVTGVAADALLVENQSIV